MKRPSMMIAGSLVVFTIGLLRTGHVERPLLAQGRHAGLEMEHDRRECGGERCDAIARGLVAFFDRRPHGLAGNGRACADCHMATDHFQLSPADAEARFQLLQIRRARHADADGPLFRPIDADDFRTNGECQRLQQS